MPERRYQIGDLVRVLPSKWDGYQGLYTVVGIANDDPDEYMLTRGDVRPWTRPWAANTVALWDVWINACRIEPWKNHECLHCGRPYHLTPARPGVPPCSCTEKK